MGHSCCQGKDRPGPQFQQDDRRSLAPVAATAWRRSRLPTVETSQYLQMLQHLVVVSALTSHLC